MTAAELIVALQALPPAANVHLLWDGAARSDAATVYLARGGHVVIADANDTVYNDEDRPETAPTYADKPFWHLGPAEDDDDTDWGDL